MITAKKLNNECLKVFKLSRHHYKSNPGIEGLPEQGIAAVLMYWGDKGTLGGNVLFGPEMCANQLPEKYKQVFIKAKKLMILALEQHDWSK